MFFFLYILGAFISLDFLWAINSTFDCRMGFCIAVLLISLFWTAITGVNDIINKS